MADIKNLQDKIRSTIYPNGKGAIQAAAHQELLLDMAAGIQDADAKVTELSAEIDNNILEVTGAVVVKIPVAPKVGWNNYRLPSMYKGQSYKITISVGGAVDTDIYYNITDAENIIVADNAIYPNVQTSEVQVISADNFHNVFLNVFCGAKTPIMNVRIQCDNSVITDYVGNYIEDAEYIRAYTDANGSFLWGIRNDGSIEWAKGIPTPIKRELQEIINRCSILEAQPTFINEIEDDEDRLEMVCDAEGKIIAYRDKFGNLVENVGVSTKFLHISEEGMSQFVKDLKAEGFSGTNDLSDEPEASIPMPTSLVKVNINAERFPNSKTSEIEGHIEFYDRNGNFFRKKIKAYALQGSTSLDAPKKNQKFDFADFVLKVGDWVAQDSFHLKSNYYDVFRGKSNLAYDLWRRIIEYNRTESFRRPFIKSSEYTWWQGQNDVFNDFNAARLTPAGFPIELYFNGEYIGIYTWNIKKDRANYAMDKNKANNIHIDPASIWELVRGESVIWKNFEIRNPKSLVTMDGAKYDGDNPAELIDSTSSYYDSSNAEHKRSASVKTSIIAFKDACSQVIEKKDKTTFEKYFDKDWFVDFCIWGNVILDGDGLTRNTQYLYWGERWYPTPYDCDQIFGNNWRGNYVYRNTTGRMADKTLLGDAVGIYDVFLDLYRTDIEERYNELRTADIISVNSLMVQLSEYVKRIGREAYEREFELWKDTPSYRKPNDNPQWEFSGDYYEGTAKKWDASTEYTMGEYVYVDVELNRYYWKCKESNIGILPYYTKYGANPSVGGYFDSLIRTEKWLKVRFDFLDNRFKRV